MEHSFRDTIRGVLSTRVFAVVGASRDPEKFGNQVYRCLKRAGYTVYAVNPNAETIEGDAVYPLLDNVPEPIDCVVSVVPPHVTETIVRQAGHLRVGCCWMQPGSESDVAIREANGLGIVTIHGGPCIMVEVASVGRGSGVTA